MENIQYTEPSHKVLPEAVLCCDEQGKIWFGSDNLDNFIPGLKKTVATKWHNQALSTFIASNSQNPVWLNNFVKIIEKNEKTGFPKILTKFNQICKCCKQKLWVQVKVNSIRLAKDKRLYLLSMQDVTEDHNLSKKIYHLSLYDNLTGALNRKGFFHVTNSLIANKQQYLLVAVNLDGFQTVNESLGPKIADKLLNNFYQRLRNIVNKQDIVARFSGDEFFILMHYQNKATMDKFLASLNQKISEPFVVENQRYFITASIGGAIYPKDSENIEQLIQYALNAVIDVKKSGRNNYKLYKPVEPKLNKNFYTIASDLWQAIENNELSLAFQPQFLLPNQQLIGFESLLRWQHPNLGFISPNEFISIAERVGLIGNLGKWVLEKNFELFNHWQKINKNLKIAINISVNQFKNRTFIEDIDNLAGKHKINPANFTLEITESIFALDSKLFIKQLNILKEMGFYLAMDDFGTGYSCLSYLKDLPIDEMKIDQSFVRQLDVSDHNNHNGAIIAAIIDLAKRLKIDIIAEGIENKQQADFLNSLGCNKMQGYLYSKPLALQDALEFAAQDTTCATSKSQ